MLSPTLDRANGPEFGLPIPQHMRFNAGQVNNLTDELYFTPNAPDGIGEVIVIPAPERNYQATLTYKF